MGIKHLRNLNTHVFKLNGWKNRSFSTLICVNPWGRVHVSPPELQGRRAGKTFHPIAWHQHPRYPVHDWLVRLFCSCQWIYVKSLKGSSYWMNDCNCKSISFTGQCVCSRLKHVRVYSLYLWTGMFVHNFYFAGSRITKNLKRSVSLWPLPEKDAQTRTFTKTDQTFFWTMTCTLLCDEGEQF